MRYFIFSRQQWPSLQVWYNNNLSLIHLGLKKPALATLYCEKAVKQYDEDYKQAGEGVGKKKIFFSSIVNIVKSYFLKSVLFFFFFFFFLLLLFFFFHLPKAKREFFFSSIVNIVKSYLSFGNGCVPD